jgi:uncharacterized protein YfaS (alpha-2-macroglobulin family)
MGLVMLAAMLALLNVGGGVRLWAPAIGAASVCLITGGILMDPARWKSAPEGAVGFVPFEVAPAVPSPAGTESEKSEAKPKAKPEAKPSERQHEEVPHDRLQGMPGVVCTNAEGRAHVDLDLPHQAACLRVRADGHADAGRIGSGQRQIVSRRPFRLEPRLPLEVGPGDRIDVPLAVVNDSDQKLPVKLVLEHGALVRLDGPAETQLELEPGKRARRYFSLDVTGQGGDCRLAFRASAHGMKHEATAVVRVVEADDRGGASRSPEGKSDAAPLRLSARLTKEKVRWGGTVRLSAELVNATEKEQTMVVGVLGLPAGLEVRPGHLDEIQRSGNIDYYQTRARQVVCYWRKLAPGKKVNLNLDLVAAIPGKYTGPACHAYLQDAAEQKYASDPLTIEITRD